MELATGPFPSRPPAAPLPEHHVDAWGDFLRRVLLLAGSNAEDDPAAVEGPLGDALPASPLAAPSRVGTSMAAE